MSDYHAYIMGADGHIIRRHDIECDADDEALDLAKMLVDGHDVEVWQRDRVVGTIKSKDHRGSG